MRFVSAYGAGWDYTGQLFQNIKATVSKYKNLNHLFILFEAKEQNQILKDLHRLGLKKIQLDCSSLQSNMRYDPSALFCKVNLTNQ